VQYLLDTNICIYLMRERPPEVAERFAALRVGDVVMSAVTCAELRHGVERCTAGAQQRTADKALGRLLELVPVLPFDVRAAEAYGRLAAAAPARRRDALDRLIASHAVSVEATLVTNDEKGFRGYAGLKIENWVG
jgi:tRNA(fMet)-specific endonuclease VapC